MQNAEHIPGTFAHAKREHARRMAQLTPAQRVRIVCDMQRLVSRICGQASAPPSRGTTSDSAPDAVPPRPADHPL